MSSINKSITCLVIPMVKMTNFEIMNPVCMQHGLNCIFHRFEHASLSPFEDMLHMEQVRPRNGRTIEQTTVL